MTELKTHSIKQVKLLCAVLKTNTIDLEEVIKYKNSYYFPYTKIIKDRRGKIIYDKNGKPKTRPINQTKGKLNDFQKIIAKTILSSYQLPSNIKGGVKGSSNIANARAHLGKHYKFKTDIKQYFPSIRYERILKMFIQNGFSNEVASLLTHLTTQNYNLPQGTPSSTIIANLVFVPIDKLLIEFCNIHKITYTRFVDDLVFSSHFDFRDKILALINIITADGFKISIKKTKHKAGNMEITGINTGQNTLSASSELKEIILDPSIEIKKTAARKKYIDQIRLVSKGHK